jgi:hypothetical protein
MIIVVGGLPRSGTSLMMQILEAAGVPIFTDVVRKPDEHNLKGYYEYEKTKRLDKDNSWIPEAEGKAIKILGHMIESLPEDHEYKLLFMERNLEEMVDSQSEMIGEETPDKEILFRGFLKYSKRLKNWIADRPNVDSLIVNYNDLVREPERIISEVFCFLGFAPPTETAMNIVDPSLWRQRK